MENYLSIDKSPRGKYFINIFFLWPWLFGGPVSCMHPCMCPACRDHNDIFTSSSVLWYTDKKSYQLSMLIGFIEREVAPLSNLQWSSIKRQVKFQYKSVNFIIKSVIRTNHKKESNSLYNLYITFNPAYGRHCISRPIRIVSPLPWREKKKLTVEFFSS